VLKNPPKIIKSIFSSIDKLAESDTKHENAFKMKNYCFFYRSLNKDDFENQDIIKFIEKAEEQFNKHRKNYIEWMIASKSFGDLFTFFGGVAECMQQGIDVEDITFQNQFSKARLKTLIKKHDGNFQKDIVDMAKRMEKHIGPKMDPYSLAKPNYNLFAETWAFMTDLFTKRVMRMEEIVKKCYTNINLKPTAAEVVDMFKAVQQEFAPKFLVNG